MTKQNSTTTNTPLEAARHRITQPKFEYRHGFTAETTVFNAAQGEDTVHLKVPAHAVDFNAGANPTYKFEIPVSELRDGRSLESIVGDVQTEGTATVRHQRIEFLKNLGKPHHALESSLQILRRQVRRGLENLHGSIAENTNALQKRRLYDFKQTHTNMEEALRSKTMQDYAPDSLGANHVLPRNKYRGAAPEEKRIGIFTEASLLERDMRRTLSSLYTDVLNTVVRDEALLQSIEQNIATTTEEKQNARELRRTAEQAYHNVQLLQDYNDEVGMRWHQVVREAKPYLNKGVQDLVTRSANRSYASLKRRTENTR